MVAARHDGKMDNWLEAKCSGNKAYKHIPLTMGYYNRADIPFYYALADAFTVCDQHFCSSLIGTSANRSYFWSGAIVRFHPKHMTWMRARIEELEKLVLVRDQEEAVRQKLEKELERLKVDIEIYTPENFEKLSEQEKAIHHKAFVTNEGDSNYQQLTDISYEEDGVQKTVKVPAGDLF